MPSAFAGKFPTGEVEATVVLDLFGNQTRIVFRDVHTNTDPAPETFRFEPPPGTDVIDLGPMPPASDPATPRSETDPTAP